MKIRVGIGYDSHRFAEGEGVLLAGVLVPADVRLTGHSDGDAVSHAVTDAVLGGAAVGDIGEMFPDDEEENRGRDSLEMLRLAVKRVKEAGWAPVQLDVTVIAEKPALVRHRDKMRAKLAGALGVEMSAVMVKGKSNERMGWIGKGRGLAVIAVATLEAV
ncbi:MAG TPA: 2-C-methyl-D-erythritol 2,4-cyclodiphosphate synthase [Gemmatimonadaceae bacterium]|nr:2-C-methyl-D-erythritol 2,4-cyclodiphosphate synthase [Gemmatimonadaceae bacterium]